MLMLRRCAWCKKFMGVKLGGKGVSITHSICESCMRRSTSDLKKSYPKK